MPDLPIVPGSPGEPADQDDAAKATVQHRSALPDETEASRVYLHLKEVFGGFPRGARLKRKKRLDPTESQAFGIGRDPKGLGDSLELLTKQLGWRAPLTQADLLNSWADIAGAETAKHSTPLGIDDGVLTVQCESTAWATQLRLMRVEIMTRIVTEFTEAGVVSIRFQGPNAPSWKKGPRSIPGRGPRDTYG
ncbi:uncharacterized protein DUF721 [Microterricola gilva]|uniref:Uncharacterized protein DUF721 n=1 Tax=Microterricola gilva TaxID=393267 RepID=A0A4Q8AQM0_9MICO|nr:DciA family protein [Microterricola gilva]RZU66957.1 uncharacterized protein DUF721 [Microterricola gilva]